MQLSFFDILIIIGMFTGFVCSILLFLKSKKKKSNKYLGLALLAFVWLNTKTLLLSLDLWSIHGIGFFPNGVELALPPLFYLYAQSLVQASFKFERRQWLHFIPFLLSQGYAIIVYIAVMTTNIYQEKLAIADLYHFNTVKHTEEYLMLISAFIYLYLGYQLIRKYRSWLESNISETQYSQLSFLNVLFFGVLFISVYILVNLIVSFTLTDEHYWRWQLAHLFIAALVYYLGLVGYKNADVVPQAYSETTNMKKAKPFNEQVKKDFADQLEAALLHDNVYLNPRLTLQDLADSMNVNEATLSHWINTHYGENFRTVINRLRVEEVKTRLKTDSLRNLSLLGLAEECGFNSEASFYRIFKNMVGVTPKQFMDAHTKHSHQ